MYITLYRPVGPIELELIEKLDWKRFPPRLEEQPFFYPVTNIEYAKEISFWNKNNYGIGYILEFKILETYILKYKIRCVGIPGLHEEYWIPANELEDFNDNIIDDIKIIDYIT